MKTLIHTLTIASFLLQQVAFAAGPGAGTSLENISVNRAWQEARQSTLYWLDQNITAQAIELPGGANPEEYRSRVRAVIQEIPMPEWTNDQLNKGGLINIPCLSSVDNFGAAHIQCNRSQFSLRVGPSRMQLLNQQYAGIAGFDWSQFQGSVALGNEKGNGGDTVWDKAWQDSRSDLDYWLDHGEHLETLQLPSNFSLNAYRASMHAAIAALSHPEWTEEELAIGTRRGLVCVNYFDIAGNPHILCNRELFAKATGPELVQLVHHEYAGIAGIELNQGSDSNYQVSQQLDKWGRWVEVYRLGVQASATAPVAIKPPANPVCAAVYDRGIENKHKDKFGHILGIGGGLATMGAGFGGMILAGYAYDAAEKSQDGIKQGLSIGGAVVGLIGILTGAVISQYEVDNRDSDEYKAQVFLSIKDLYNYPWFDENNNLIAFYSYGGNRGSPQNVYEDVTNALVAKGMRIVPDSKDVQTHFYDSYANGALCPNGKALSIQEMEAVLVNQFLQRK